MELSFPRTFAPRNVRWNFHSQARIIIIYVVSCRHFSIMLFVCGTDNTHRASECAVIPNTRYIRLTLYAGWQFTNK